MRELLAGVVFVAAMGALGWTTAPSIRPPPPPGVEAPTVRELALASLDDLTLRAEALRVLGFVGTDDDVPRIAALAADPRWTTPATKALIDLLDEDALPVLEPMLDNRWFAGRRDLVLALGHAHDPASAAVLVDLYTTADQSWIVYAAAEALAARQEPSAIAPFAKDFERSGYRMPADRLTAYPAGSPAREVLYEAVRSGRQPHGNSALTALAEVGDPEVVPLLIDALQARDPDRRDAALSGLGAIDDPRAVPALLAHEDRIDRTDELVEWMGALWAADTPEAHDAAFRVLATAPVGRARETVAAIPESALRAMPGTFVEMVEQRPGALAEELVDALLEVEWETLPAPILGMARRRLARNPSFWAEDAPTRLLFHFGTPEDRSRAGEILARKADEGDPRALRMFRAIPRQQRTEAHVEALVVLLAYTADHDDVAAIFGNLEDHLDDERVAQLALAQLDRMTLESVMRHAVKLPEGRERIEALAASGTKRERVAAKRVLDDGKPQRNGTIFDHLPLGLTGLVMDLPDTVEGRIEALDSADFDTSFGAALALGDSADPRAAEALEEMVREGGPFATIAATKLPPTRQREVIAELFDDPAPERRRLALQLGGSRDVQLVEDGLDDEHPVVRAAAVSALESRGSSVDAARIRDLLDDEDPDVRAAAARSLLDLGGVHAREEADRIAELVP
jgi:HEAT repeat protein